MTEAGDRLGSESPCRNGITCLRSGMLTVAHMRSFFLWLYPVRLYSLYNILYPKRRIDSYFIMDNSIPPKKYYSYELYSLNS